MGQHEVEEGGDGRKENAFVRALLNDIAALERMLDGCLIESGVRRVGAEQEMFLNIMKDAPVTVSPSTPTLEAVELMRARGVGCLPVIERGVLVGIITAHDFLAASACLFEERLRANTDRLV